MPNVTHEAEENRFGFPIASMRWFASLFTDLIQLIQYVAASSDIQNRYKDHDERKDLYESSVLSQREG